jgi:hypothetical protein
MVDEMTPKQRYLTNKARRLAHAARVAAKRIYAKRQRQGWYRWQD